MPVPGLRPCRIVVAAVLALTAGTLGSVATNGSPSLAHSAASGAGAAAGAGATASADIAQFAVGSPAMANAELIATKYWGVSPCHGAVAVSWAPLDPSINGNSTWWNPVSAYGNAAANDQCAITLNQNQEFDWPMFCTVMVHEIGHLAGQQHTTDPASVMYPFYVAPITECKGTPTGAAAPAPAAARVATTKKPRAGAHHKAHRRHQAVKRHPAA